MIVFHAIIEFRNYNDYHGTIYVSDEDNEITAFRNFHVEMYSGKIAHVWIKGKYCARSEINPHIENAIYDALKTYDAKN